MDYYDDNHKARTFRREEVFAVGILLLFVGLVLVWSNPSPTLAENIGVSVLSLFLAIGAFSATFSSKNISGVIGKPLTIRFATIEGVVVLIVLFLSYFLFNSSYGAVMVLTSSAILLGAISFLARILDIRERVNG